MTDTTREAVPDGAVAGRAPRDPAFDPFAPLAPLGTTPARSPVPPGARTRLSSANMRRAAPTPSVAPPRAAVPRVPAPAEPLEPAQPVTSAGAPLPSRPSSSVVRIGAALVVLLVAAIVVLLWRPGSTADTVDAVGTERAAAVPAPPVVLVADDEYVRTEVLDNGDLQVDHWLRTSRPVRELTLGVPSVPGPGAEAIGVEDLVVVGDGTAVPAAGLDLVSGSGTAALSDVTELYVGYRLTGVVQRSGSVPGRALATVAALTLGAGDQALARTVVFAGGKVTALACLAGDPGATPVPCGALVGDAWTLHTDAGEAPDSVIVQLDLSAAGDH